MARDGATMETLKDDRGRAIERARGGRAGARSIARSRVGTRMILNARDD